MAKFLIVIEGDDNGKATIERDGKDVAMRISDKMRQMGYTVESSRFSRGGVEEPQSAEGRAKAKADARAAELKARDDEAKAGKAPAGK
jgi:hypothetical protein